MNSVSFSAAAIPAQRQPVRFSGDRNPYGHNRAYYNFGVDDSYTTQHYHQTQQHQQPEEGAMKRAAKKTGKMLGVAGIVAAVTSPLWAPITGVGIACNKNGPDGAIAKIKPVAGAGPAVADALCPSVFVMPNGDLMSNDPPSWTSFTNKVGHVYKNGLITHLNGVDGAYKDGDFFSADLIRGLQSAQIAASNPENFTITTTEGAAPVKTVDEDGNVKSSQKKNGYHQKYGSVKLMGPYEGKKLKDVPKEEREMIKAAAAAHSYTWAG